MNTDFNLIQDLILPIAGFIIVALLSGLIFFTRRVLRKVDEIAEVVFQRLPTYQAKVEAISLQMAEVKMDLSRMTGEFKEVSALRERVAVLEYAERQRKSRAHDS